MLTTQKSLSTGADEPEQSPFMVMVWWGLGKFLFLDIKCESFWKWRGINAADKNIDKTKRQQDWRARAKLLSDNKYFDHKYYYFLTTGITLLTVALFVSARMGIYQEVLYKKHGKYSHEALYITVILILVFHKALNKRKYSLQHLLPLPGFLLLYSNIWQHIQITNASEAMLLPVVGSMPSQWVYLIGNVLTQYICISSVYVLTAECSSLTVTLVVTLRKFVSLLFSIVYFDNPFTIYHWMGTLLVFIGTIIFTEVVPSIRKSMNKKVGITAEAATVPAKKKD